VREGLDVKGIIEFLSAMTEKTGYPVPAPSGFASRWSEGLDLPRGGSERLLFTGALYQLMPYLNAVVRLVEGLGGLPRVALKSLTLLARQRPWALAGLVRPDGEEVRASELILRSIAALLRRSGADFAYVPEVSDLYSGALLLDLGAVDAFEAHARRVSKAINSLNVSEVITVDPHTALTLTIMRRRGLLRPSVRSYLELVSPVAVLRTGGFTVTVHDSCIYARDLDLWERSRNLLASALVQVSEARRSGRRTSCCGGPVEALSPFMSRRVAEERLRELARYSKVVVTMCPICASNLSRAAARLDGVRVVDLAPVLSGNL